MIDKVMTKVTNRINQGDYLRNEEKSREETAREYNDQTRVIEEKYGNKFPEIVVILKKLTKDILTETYADR